MSYLLRAFLTLLFVVLTPGLLEAQRNCVKGKPCGRTCIARDKVCRIGAPGRTTPSAPRPAPSASVPGEPPPARPAIGPQRARSAGAVASSDRCVVDSVTDGDTLRCGGVPIRLLLIDAPEMDQGPWGEVAKAALTSLAPPGTELRLEYDVDPNDRYDRVLAYLHLDDGRMINEELLGMGVALVSVYPPNVKYVDQFRATQEEAVRNRAGLWSVDAFACTPADHRAGRCE